MNKKIGEALDPRLILLPSYAFIKLRYGFGGKTKIQKNLAQN
ncbi:MAG: hypothetical protein ACFE85_17080 [Candidatus Hodarchaeota archaeon]